MCLFKMMTRITSSEYITDCGKNSSRFLQGNSFCNYFYYDISCNFINKLKTVIVRNDVLGIYTTLNSVKVRND